MARSPKLNRAQVGKHAYWSTDAGGRRVYFGKVGEVSRKQAETQFADHLKAIRTETNAQRDVRLANAPSVWELCDRHNLWYQANRADRSYRQRRSLLQSFCNYQVSGQLYGRGQLIGDLAVDRITLQHAQEFIATIHDPCTRLHHVIAIKASFNWAARPAEADGGGLVPESCQPFKYLKRPHVSPKDLTEADLITPEEYALLLRYAKCDTTKIRGEDGRYRERTNEERFHADDNPYQCFFDLLICFHAFGPRTSEPLNCRVRDFNRRTKQLTLGKHKRTQTQRNTTLRQLMLSEEAYEIVQRRCAGKQPNDPIFTLSNGSPWTQERFNERFREVKGIIKMKFEAKQEETFVRKHIVPYAFRDLYISELLMIGIPPFKVSKMAGTSLKEIERTYGHFFSEDLAAAQEALDHARADREGKAKVLKMAQ